MKFLKKFNSIEDANAQGALGLDSPHVDIVELQGGGVVTNFIRVATDTFTCEFNESGKTENIVPVEPEYEMVDLGLPSGLKWANKNIGAESPEDYGLYFAFGATEGYKPEDGHDFSLANCPYYDSATGTWTKYTTAGTLSDNRDSILTHGSILEPEDDAANVILGNGWRMPTGDDFIELYQNTDVTLDNNIATFTNKNDSTKFIKFHAPGEINGTTPSGVGTSMRMCGSEVMTEVGRLFQFGMTQVSYPNLGAANKYRGHVIRPVHD